MVRLARVEEGILGIAAIRTHREPRAFRIKEEQTLEHGGNVQPRNSVAASSSSRASSHAVIPEDGGERLLTCAGILAVHGQELVGSSIHAGTAVAATQD